MSRNVLAVTTISYLPYPLGDALRGIAAAGFQKVELAAIPGVCEHVNVAMDDAAVHQVRDLLTETNLDVIAVSAHADLTTVQGVAYTHRALDLASKLGAAILNTAVGGPANENEDESLFLDHIGELAEHAQKNKVLITIEVHGRVTANGTLCAALVRRVNHHNVRVNYDTANCIYFGDTPPYADLTRALPETSYVHLKDKRGGKHVWNFPALGTGEIDLERVLTILQRGGYTGPLCVEIEFERGPYPTLEQVNRAVQDSYTTLQALYSKPKPGVG